MKRLFLAACLSAALTSVAKAHDTDQFSVPQGQEIADVGPMLSVRYTRDIRRAVDKLNDKIQWAIEHQDKAPRPVRRPANRPGRRVSSRGPDPEAVLRRAQSPGGVADAVNSEFGSAVALIEDLERELHSNRIKRRFDGKLPAYKAKSDWNSIYNEAYSPIDPRNISAIFHASTINMYGTYLGTDKIGHFVDMGYHYYKTYHNQIEKGNTEQEAMAKAVEIGTDGIFSEKGLLGFLTAGSYSNADLISNYVGCLFYRNLTEPVMLEGQVYEPIVVRDGDFWKVRDDIDDEQLFARFISDHWNEALNPSLYEPLMRDTVRKAVQERNPSLLDWYKDRYGDQDPAEYFTDLARELSTYYGQDYGHGGDWERLIHIGNTIQQPDPDTRKVHADK